MLEDEHEHAVRGGDGEQVEHDCLHGHDDRAEGDEQEQKGESEHERDHVRHPVLDLIREVDVLGCQAGDRRFDAGNAAERLRDQVVA